MIVPLLVGNRLAAPWLLKGQPLSAGNRKCILHLKVEESGMAEEDSIFFRLVSVRCNLEGGELNFDAFVRKLLRATW
jgi:hypothetical protein